MSSLLPLRSEGRGASGAAASETTQGWEETGIPPKRKGTPGTACYDCFGTQAKLSLPVQHHF